MQEFRTPPTLGHFLCQSDSSEHMLEADARRKVVKQGSEHWVFEPTRDKRERNSLRVLMESHGDVSLNFSTCCLEHDGRKLRRHVHQETGESVMRMIRNGFHKLTVACPRSVIALSCVCSLIRTCCSTTKCGLPPERGMTTLPLH